MSDKKLSDFDVITPDGSESVLALQLGEPVLLSVNNLGNLVRTASGLYVRSVTADRPRTSNVAAAVPDLDAMPLTAGTWVIEGSILWSSADVTNGIDLYLSATGSVTNLLAHWTYVSTGTSASTGIADGTAGAQLLEGRAQRGSVSTNPLTGVDTINSPCLMTVQGLIVVPGNVTLDVMFRSENNGTSVSVLAGSSVVLTQTKVG